MLSRSLSTLLVGIGLGVTNTAKLVKCVVLQIVVFSSVIGIVWIPLLLQIELFIETHLYSIFCKLSVINRISAYKKKLIEQI